MSKFIDVRTATLHNQSSCNIILEGGSTIYHKTDPYIIFSCKITRLSLGLQICRKVNFF